MKLNCRRMWHNISYTVIGRKVFTYSKYLRLKIIFMKKKWYLLIAGMLFFSVMVSAQAVTKDSINVLTNEKEKLKVAKTLNENKLKLAKLENQVAERNAAVEKTTEGSQKAASDNQEAATKLTGDSQDKGKAKDARKAANHAENKAKNARKAMDKLNDLNKDIDELKKKIKEDEQKLVSLGGTVQGIN